MYEYAVIPAPRRPKKFRGLKGSHQQFAAVVAELINAHAEDGWEYQRAETLPVDEKPGLLKGRVEMYHSVLIFRRLLDLDASVPEFEQEEQTVTPEMYDDEPLPEPEVLSEEATVDYDAQDHAPAEPRLTRD